MTNEPLRGVRVDRRGAEAWITLDRPELRNALDDGVIAALTRVARELAPADDVRVVVLTGEGPAFCAGADLAWMRRARDHDEARNLADASAAADMFHAIASLPMPVVARAHGAALGGGAGLLCVSDLVVAADDLEMGFSESRAGLLPATIAPYVVARIGPGLARRLFLRGHRFTAAEALHYGLVDRVCPAAQLDDVLRATLSELALGAPSAHRATKALLRTLAPLPDPDVRRVTAEAIARQRVSPEGQEGLRAVLEGRAPRWSPS